MEKLFIHVFVLVLCFVFRTDTSLFVFALTFENLILHIILIIMIIIPCSGMFQNVLECSLFLVLSPPPHQGLPVFLPRKETNL